MPDSPQSADCLIGEWREVQVSQTAKSLALAIQQAIDRPLYRIFLWPIWMLIAVPCLVGALLGITFPIWSLPGAEAWTGLVAIVAGTLRLSTSMASLQERPFKWLFILIGLVCGIALAAYFLSLMWADNVQPGVSIYSGALVFGTLMLAGTIDVRK